MIITQQPFPACVQHVSSHVFSVKLVNTEFIDNSELPNILKPLATRGWILGLQKCKLHQGFQRGINTALFQDALHDIPCSFIKYDRPPQWCHIDIGKLKMSAICQAHSLADRECHHRQTDESLNNLFLGRRQRFNGITRFQFFEQKLNKPETSSHDTPG